MELLETNDAKSLLLKKSAKHKKGLEDEVKLLSENTEKIVTNALIIGGTLALTYFLISQFSKSKSKGKSKAKKIKLIKEQRCQRRGSLARTMVQTRVSLQKLVPLLLPRPLFFYSVWRKINCRPFYRQISIKKPQPTNERS